MISYDRVEKDEHDVLSELNICSAALVTVSTTISKMGQYKEYGESLEGGQLTVSLLLRCRPGLYKGCGEEKGSNDTGAHID